MPCPHCGERLIVRGSEQIAPTVRNLRMNCDECGFRGMAQLALTHVSRQSDAPVEGVRLPFSNPNLLWPRRRAANDDAPVPANDDAEPVPAVAESLPGPAG